MENKIWQDVLDWLLQILVTIVALVAIIPLAIVVGVVGGYLAVKLLIYVLPLLF